MNVAHSLTASYSARDFRPLSLVVLDHVYLAVFGTLGRVDSSNFRIQLLAAGDREETQKTRHHRE